MVEATMRTSRESGRVTSIRHLITLLIFLFVVLLGYPLFVSTTTIHRAELPTQETYDLADNYLNNLHFRIPIYLDLPNSSEHFVSSAQQLIDKELYSKHPELKNLWGLDLKRANAGPVNPDVDYLVKFKYLGNDEQDATEAFALSPHNKEAQLILTPNVVKSKNVEDFLKRVLIDEIFTDEIEAMAEVARNQGVKESDLVMPYSAHYNLVFSLMVENGVSIQWDIENAIALFRPILKNLSHFSNFTVLTQIQYYSTLTSDVQFNETEKAYMLDKEELSTFINFGDWNLINHDMSPTVNFLIYFPKSNYEGLPMSIKDSTTNSFLVPQWGGVHILNKMMANLNGTAPYLSSNDLYPSMEIFASQLFQLLGVPNHSKSPLVRLDKLFRVRAVKNIKSALEKLKALIKLTNSLNEIKIPDQTKDYATKALNKIHECFDLVSQQNFGVAMELSSEALDNSNKAFFEKSMVQQAYFPSEHKLAVFLPLLGPVGSIVTIGILKLFQEYVKKMKKTKTE